jgi:hypothetical protein
LKKCNNKRESVKGAEYYQFCLQIEVEDIVQAQKPFCGIPLLSNSDNTTPDNSEYLLLRMP